VLKFRRTSNPFLSVRVQQKRQERRKGKVKTTSFRASSQHRRGEKASKNNLGGIRSPERGKGGMEDFYIKTERFVDVRLLEYQILTAQ